MEFSDYLNDLKTNYTITDEHNTKSTITLDKWVADLLQETLPDVHIWIQEKYNLICEKKPSLSRREKGNLIRELARKEAESSPSYRPPTDFI